MANALSIGRFIKDLDPIVASLIVAVIIIGSYNGWDIISKKKDREKVTAHLMLAWTNLFNLANRKTKIVYYNIIADQMRIVDSTLYDMMHTFQDIFFDLKKGSGHNPAHLVQSKDIKVYTFILHITRDEIKTQIRRMLQENHLSEKSEKDLQYYIRQQYELVSREVTKNLNEMYDDNDVPRDVLYRANHAIDFKLFDQFSSMVRSCRDVAIRYEGELRQIDKQVQRIIQKGEVDGCNVSD